MGFALFFILFFLGASLGSFLYATALRLISGEDFVRQRSRCPACNETLRWFQLIPVVSYVLLGGKCKRCKAPFSLEYLIAELFMGGYAAYLGYAVFQGLLRTPFSLIFAAYGGNGEAALYFLYLLLGSVLFLLLIVDYKTQFILMAPVRALLILGILLLIASGMAGEGSFWDSNARMTATLAFLISAGFFFLWAGTRGRGLGYGDVEFSLLLSIFLPYPLALIMVLVSFWTGALTGIGLMLAKGYTMKSQIPFGPFLIIGFFITLFWGELLMARLLPLP